MSLRRRSTGFTLIEILVVISIIGLLSAIVLGSLNTARIKGRDAARIVDVRELKKALEFYYNNQTTPSYPILGARNGPNDIALLEDPLINNPPTRYIGAIAPVLKEGTGSEPDYYGWGGASGSGPADSYALVVYTETAGTWCKTGGGPNFTSIMPSLTTICNF